MSRQQYKCLDIIPLSYKLLSCAIVFISILNFKIKKLKIQFQYFLITSDICNDRVNTKSILKVHCKISYLKNPLKIILQKKFLANYFTKEIYSKLFYSRNSLQIILLQKVTIKQIGHNIHSI